MSNKQHNLYVKTKKQGRPHIRKRLREERLKRKMTLEDVVGKIADKFCKSYTSSHIGAIEKGRVNPSPELLQYLIMLYDLQDLTFEELLS